MNPAVNIHRNLATATEISVHLRACDLAFVPALSERIEIDAYAAKIAALAERFEAWSDQALIGMVAAYCNDPDSRVAFVTSVSVVPQQQGLGIASQLLRHCIEHVRPLGFERIELEVDRQNTAATVLYRRHGFSVSVLRERTETLNLTL